MSEQERQHTLENRYKEAVDSITLLLFSRPSVDSHGIPQKGKDYTEVYSDPITEGYTSLILSPFGGFDVKMGMNGEGGIGKDDLEGVLDAYAFVSDPTYKEIEDIDDEEVYSVKKQAYWSDNKDRALWELVQHLERAENILEYDAGVDKAKRAVTSSAQKLGRKYESIFNAEIKLSEQFYRGLIDELDKKGVLFQSKEEMLNVRAPENSI